MMIVRLLLVVVCFWGAVESITEMGPQYGPAERKVRSLSANWHGLSLSSNAKTLRYEDSFDYKMMTKTLKGNGRGPFFEVHWDYKQEYYNGTVVEYDIKYQLDWIVEYDGSSDYGVFNDYKNGKCVDQKCGNFMHGVKAFTYDESYVEDAAMSVFEWGGEMSNGASIVMRVLAPQKRSTRIIPGMEADDNLEDNVAVNEKEEKEEEEEKQVEGEKEEEKEVENQGMDVAVAEEAPSPPEDFFAPLDPNYIKMDIEIRGWKWEMPAGRLAMGVSVQSKEKLRNPATGKKHTTRLELGGDADNDVAASFGWTDHAVQQQRDFRGQVEADFFQVAVSKVPEQGHSFGVGQYYPLYFSFLSEHYSHVEKSSIYWDPHVGADYKDNQIDTLPIYTAPITYYLAFTVLVVAVVAGLVAMFRRKATEQPLEV